MFRISGSVDIPGKYFIIILPSVAGGFYEAFGISDGLRYPTRVIRLDGVEAVREIDENVNNLPHSGESDAFHGWDVYAYTGARLASGISNSVTNAIVGSLLCVAYAATKTKAGSLTKE